MMQYFLIEKHKSVFRIFDNTDFNTYGVLLSQIGNFKLHYSGNFWWMKPKYAKTLDLTGIKANRSAAEVNFIQNGTEWNPYSPYNNDVINNYEIYFKREEYAK